MRARSRWSGSPLAGIWRRVSVGPTSVRTGVHGISLAKAHTAKGRADYVDDHIAGWLPDSVRFIKATLGDFASVTMTAN